MSITSHVNQIAYKEPKRPIFLTANLIYDTENDIRTLGCHYKASINELVGYKKHFEDPFYILADESVEIIKRKVLISTLLKSIITYPFGVSGGDWKWLWSLSKKVEHNKYQNVLTNSDVEMVKRIACVIINDSSCSPYEMELKHYRGRALEYKETLNKLSGQVVQ